MWGPQQNMMWPGPQQPQQQQQQHHRVPHPYGHFGMQPQIPHQQPPLLPDPTSWQQHPNDFLLEQQFSHMSFRQPPPIYQQQQQPLRPPTRPVIQHQQQILPQQQQPNNPAELRSPSAMINGSGIPSLLDIRVPVPSHLNNHNGYRGPMTRPPPSQPQPRKLPKFDTFSSCFRFLIFFENIFVNRKRKKSILTQRIFEI